MTKEQRLDIERYIKERAAEYFKRDRSGKGYICPICGSGGGVNGTGITENKKSRGHFTCWGRGACFRNADIFQIIGLQYGLKDFNEQFDRACEIFRIDVDGGRPSATLRTPPKNQTDNKNGGNKSMNENEEVKDFTEFLRQAAANLSMTDYYRGISVDTLKKFGVGFMPEWRANDKAPSEFNGG